MLERIGIALLLFFFAVAGGLTPLVARGEEAEKPSGEVMVWRSTDGNVLRLFDEPCPVASGWLKLRRAQWIYKGKNYEACWMLHRARVVIIDDDGDLNTAHWTEFTVDEGV